MHKSRILAVVGPTGAGKTKIGSQLAERFNGIILSADSRQVYVGLDVGSNKEGRPGEWRGLPAHYIGQIPQLLIDIAKPGERFTLANWLSLAKIAISEVEKEGKLPIVVGGTGLYVTALLENWQPPKEKPKVRARLEKLSLEELQEISEEQAVSNSDHFNRRRLIKIVERGVINPIYSESTSNALILEVEVDRDTLYRRAETRYRDNWSLLKAEVEQLLRQGVSKDWLESLGLDYRMMIWNIYGKFSKTETIQRYSFAAHAFIRRQKTWWRHHGHVSSISSFTEAYTETAAFLHKE